MIHRPEEFDTSLAPLRGDGQVKEEECFFLCWITTEFYQCVCLEEDQ